jgi:hypothetical protein
MRRDAERVLGIQIAAKLAGKRDFRVVCTLLGLRDGRVSDVTARGVPRPLGRQGKRRTGTRGEEFAFLSVS